MHLVLNMFIFTRTLVTYARTIFNSRQGYREIKLHVILVGAMGTIYKDYTDKPLADLNLWVVEPVKKGLRQVDFVRRPSCSALALELNAWQFALKSLLAIFMLPHLLFKD